VQQADGAEQEEEPAHPSSLTCGAAVGEVGPRTASSGAMERLSGLLAKDVGIAADLMRSVNLDAPLAAQINERYKTAIARLGTARDNSEAILAWDNNNQGS